MTDFDFTNGYEDLFNEWDTSWNCQRGRLTNEEAELPWEDDDE